MTRKFLLLAVIGLLCIAGKCLYLVGKIKNLSGNTLEKDYLGWETWVCSSPYLKTFFILVFMKLYNNWYFAHIPR